MQKHAKMVRNISGEINLDKKLEVFSLNGSTSGIWKYLVSLLKMENTQNMYPNFSSTIVIVFTIFQVS